MGQACGPHCRGSLKSGQSKRPQTGAQCPEAAAFRVHHRSPPHSHGPEPRPGSAPRPPVVTSSFIWQLSHTMTKVCSAFPRLVGRNRTWGGKDCPAASCEGASSPSPPPPWPHPLPRASPPGRLPGVQPRLWDKKREFTETEIKMALKQHV